MQQQFESLWVGLTKSRDNRDAGVWIITIKWADVVEYQKQVRNSNPLNLRDLSVLTHIAHPNDSEFWNWRNSIKKDISTKKLVSKD